MAFCYLNYDREDPRFKNYPDYVCLVDTENLTADLRRRQVQARQRARETKDERYEACLRGARGWFVAGAVFLALAASFCLLEFWVAGLLFGGLAVFSGYPVLSLLHGTLSLEARLVGELADIDEHYDRLIATSEESDRYAAQQTERARERYRELWRALRAGEGGFDRYLAELAQPLSEGQKAEFLGRLRSDFDFYYEFLRRGLLDDDDGKQVPVIVAFERRQAADEAARRPVSLREFRAQQAREAFRRSEGDDDIARFLATRTMDALPAFPEEVE